MVLGLRSSCSGSSPVDIPARMGAASASYAAACAPAGSAATASSSVGSCAAQLRAMEEG